MSDGSPIEWLLDGVERPGMTATELAATVHAYFAGRPLRYHPAADMADPDGGGRDCPTCEGEGRVPFCTYPACPCDDDPDRSRCPTMPCGECGGLGSI